MNKDTLDSIKTWAMLLEGCLIREHKSGNNSFEIYNAAEHLINIKDELKSAGVEPYADGELLLLVRGAMRDG